MAGTEVIHFLFSAQLTSRSFFRALLLPGPVAESPPNRILKLVSPIRSAFDRVAISVPNTFVNCRTDSGVFAPSNRGDSNAKGASVRGNSLGESRR